MGRQGATALRHVGGGLLDFLRDAGSPFQEGKPVLRQGQVARGTMHESRAEASLEVDQPVAHHGFDKRSWRAASLIDPASATATKVVMPSSFTSFGFSGSQFHHAQSAPEDPEALSVLRPEGAQ